MILLTSKNINLEANSLRAFGATRSETFGESAHWGRGWLWGDAWLSCRCKSYDINCYVNYGIRVNLIMLSLTKSDDFHFDEKSLKCVKLYLKNRLTFNK